VPSRNKKIEGAAGRNARATKKRKVDVEEEPESQGEEANREDAKQLHPSLNGFDEDGEKV
jgi:hypothetical protein